MSKEQRHVAYMELAVARNMHSIAFLTHGIRRSSSELQQGLFHLHKILWNNGLQSLQNNNNNDNNNNNNNN